MRKCVIPNYIPYRNHKKTTFRKWFRRYRIDVIQLHDIFYKIDNERYNEKFIVPTERDIINFGFFLYKTSSKHIQD